MIIMLVAVSGCYWSACPPSRSKQITLKTLRNKRAIQTLRIKQHMDVHARNVVLIGSQITTVMLLMNHLCLSVAAREHFRDLSGLH